MKVKYKCICTVFDSLTFIFLNSGTSKIFEVSRMITPDIVYFVPRNSNVEQVTISTLSRILISVIYRVIHPHAFHGDVLLDT